MAQVHAVELKGNQQELSPNKGMGWFGWRSSSNKTSKIKPKKNAQVSDEKIKERKQEQAIIVPYFATSARLRRTENVENLRFYGLGMNREMQVRRRIASIYNKREDNFASLRDYKDYLEDVEDIIFNLVQGINVDETEAKIKAYNEENYEQILTSRARKREFGCGSGGDVDAAANEAARADWTQPAQRWRGRGSRGAEDSRGASRHRRGLVHRLLPQEGSHGSFLQLVDQLEAREEPLLNG
ncbi:hypothetical protein SELMODRAFT_428018 [Selaginella moellendorffii]|uniref:MAT1 centre domain-containing protein n=1 Tax=Selaginella moellendorffii TaxID=88036 RepID=D8T1G1_SELML|nr:hypothetical protein SELMODRAFT_428018 [Selaginella moellendorffii]